MKILVLNCGSSSIKYKLFDMTTKEVLAQGGIEKIGLVGSFLKLTLPNGEKKILEKDIRCAMIWTLRARASKHRLQASATPTMPRKINLCKTKLLYRKER